MPAKGARCLTWDCPRNLAGPWRARGRGLPDAGQGRGSPGGCAGEVREDVQGRTSGRMPARGPLGGGPGPGVARKYSCNFLKVLQRVRASGRRRHGASPRPPAPPWTRSRHRVPGTGPRGRLGVHRPRRGAAGREPGTSTLPPARAPTGRTTRPPSRPEKQPRGAPLRLATATDADAEREVPGHLWEQVNIKLNSPGPHPQAHRMGRRQGRQAQAPTGPPRTPGPAASRRRPDRRTPRRPN